MPHMVRHNIVFQTSSLIQEKRCPYFDLNFMCTLMCVSLETKCTKVQGYICISKGFVVLIFRNIQLFTNNHVSVKNK